MKNTSHLEIDWFQESERANKIVQPIVKNILSNHTQEYILNAWREK